MKPCHKYIWSLLSFKLWLVFNPDFLDKINFKPLREDVLLPCYVRTHIGTAHLQSYVQRLHFNRNIWNCSMYVKSAPPRIRKYPSMKLHTWEKLICYRGMQFWTWDVGLCGLGSISQNFILPKTYRIHFQYQFLDKLPPKKQQIPTCV
jgi:hypothetical protein